MSNMSECLLDKKTEDAFGYRIYRVTNDVNGNPRYVTTWMAFADDYQSALKIARSEGFRVYRGKDFGGGFVAQSYNLESTVEGIIAIRKKEEIAKEFVGFHKVFEMPAIAGYAKVYSNLEGGVYGETRLIDEDTGEFEIEIPGSETVSGNPTVFNFFEPRAAL